MIISRHGYWLDKLELDSDRTGPRCRGFDDDGADCQ